MRKRARRSCTSDIQLEKRKLLAIAVLEEGRKSMEERSDSRMNQIERLHHHQ